MNRYEPRTPRTLFAALAIALTAATIGLAVVAPAAHAPYDASTLAARRAPAIDVTITPSTIEVFAVRDTPARPLAEAAPDAQPVADVIATARPR
jgi:hypothetical protein